MIKPGFITSQMIMVVVLAMGGLSYGNLLTVTAQNPDNDNTEISFSSKNVRNTTTIGDRIVHRVIVSSEEPTFLVL